MSGFSELIKNFDKTRDYVRDFFIYGCKVRNDFNRKSSRTYDDEKRRVESWMNDYIRFDNSVRGRQVSISVDSCHIHENPLYSAYYSRSFTDNDIKLHFLLTDVLADGNCHTLKDIADLLADEYGQFFEEQTVRNKLNEYVKEGIVIAVKKGNKLFYKLLDDCTDELFRDFEGIDDAVKFFSEIQQFGIVGNSLLKSAGLKNDLFFMKHNYIIHTLEDVLMPEILEAVEEKRFVSLTMYKFGNDKEKDSASTEFIVVPYKFYVSVQTGRRYLAAFIPKQNKYTTFRLDRIRKVKKCGVCEEYESIRKTFEAKEPHCYGVSFGNGGKDDIPVLVKITFYADEQTEPFIPERLEREKRNCKLEKTDENLYTLTAEIFDVNEIMHWLKTLIGRIVKIEGGSETVNRRFYSDVERMYDMYGGERDEHIQ